MTLTLPLPPTANLYYRSVGKRVLISAAGRAFKSHCSLLALAQKAERHEGEVKVAGTVYMARLGCDLDNRTKPLLDALKGVCYADDIQVAEIHLRRGLDRSDPRVEITITPIEASHV